MCNTHTIAEVAQLVFCRVESDLAENRWEIPLPLGEGLGKGVDRDLASMAPGPSQTSPEKGAGLSLAAIIRAELFQRQTSALLKSIL